MSVNHDYLAAVKSQNVEDESLTASDIGPNAVGDSEISAHTSTKITIVTKGQLNAQIGYKDESNWLTDAMVSAHTSTKITITNKSLLNTQIAYKDESNWLTDAMVAAHTTTKITVPYSKLTGLAIVNTDIAAGALIDFSKLAALASGNLLIGSGANVPTSVAMSGDATISNAGALTIANNAVNDAKIAAHTSTKITITAKGQLNSQIAYKDETLWLTDGMISTSAAIAFSKLASLTGGNILVGNVSNVATSVAMSGDATLSNAGALTIANNAVNDAKIGAHTSTKITITAKGQLNSQIAYKDETDWLTNAMVNSAAAIAKTKIATAGQWTAAEIPNLESLNGTLTVAKGGTGLGALGTALQVLRVNAGATALEFATVSGLTKHKHDADTDAAGGLFSDIFMKSINALFVADKAISTLWQTAVIGTGAVLFSFADNENQIDVNSGATSGGVGRLEHPMTNCNVSDNGALTVIARLNAGGDTQLRVSFGLWANDDGSADNDDGFGFRVDAVGTAVNWFAVNGNGLANTTTDTGILADNTYHVFHVVRIGSSILFYIDGVLKATHTTNLPTNAGEISNFGAYATNKENVTKRLIIKMPVIIIGFGDE